MSEKYRKEIEEILENAGEVAPDEPSDERERHPEDLPAWNRQPRLPRKQTSGSSWRWPSIKPGKVLLAGLVLFVVAALLKLGPLVWVGLGMLVVAYLLFYITPRSVSYEKRWRGRPVEDSYSSPWERFKRWLKS